MKYQKEACADVIKNKYAPWLDDNGIAIFYASAALFLVSFVFHQVAEGRFVETALSILSLAVSFCFLLSPIVGNIMRDD
ncbi:hypothetical protein AA14337_3068 [Acetobacter malorum DSM 14337]|uniref:Uncharacterized protein n=1 Tax=Acetobacter malorum DSM 14337 TaxID=1307910 RepID=A0ABQ0PZF7_9PROT|nr:hypothetical protein AD930_11010 [Acetobacter malorum]GBQ85424.1 hypothetical protein AA14337_3068 [Acetobacter malorum DSM 14337]